MSGISKPRYNSDFAVYQRIDDGTVLKQQWKVQCNNIKKYHIAKNIKLSTATLSLALFIAALALPFIFGAGWLAVLALEKITLYSSILIGASTTLGFVSYGASLLCSRYKKQITAMRKNEERHLIKQGMYIEKEIAKPILEDLTSPSQKEDFLRYQFIINKLKNIKSNALSGFIARLEIKRKEWNDKCQALFARHLKEITTTVPYEPLAR